MSMVDQYHAFLLSNLQAPFSLLINKVHHYSFDFHAQQNLDTLNEITAICVVVYNQMAQVTTESLASFPRESDRNMQIFLNRDNALAWLISQQGKTVRLTN